MPERVREMKKRIFAMLLIAALLASCQPIVPAEESSLTEPESSAVSFLPAAESSETSAFTPEELDTAQLYAKKIMDCLACHGLTHNARRTGEITDEEIWRFVLGTCYYRDDPDFPYRTWFESNSENTTAYFPIPALQEMVEELFGVSQWMPDFVRENCNESLGRLMMPTEIGLSSVYGYENIQTEVLSEDTVAVSMSLVDSPAFPGGQNYGEYTFQFSLEPKEGGFFLRLKEFRQTAALESGAAVSGNGEPFAGQLTAEEEEKWLYQAERTADCLARYVLSDGMIRDGQVEDRDIWAFLLASILYREDFAYPAWTGTSPDGNIAYFPEKDIQTTVAQLFGISDWCPEFMRESMSPETNRLEMRLAENFAPFHSSRNAESRTENGNRFTVSAELTDISGTESLGRFSFIFTLFQDGTEQFLRLTEFGPEA